MKPENNIDMKEKTYTLMFDVDKVFTVKSKRTWVALLKIIFISIRVNYSRFISKRCSISNVSDVIIKLLPNGQHDER